MRIEVVRVKPLVRAPLRLRLRYWWMRRRMTPAQRQLVDEVSARAEREFLFGDRP